MVFVGEYRRIRYGRIELIRAHWRSLPKHG